MILSRNHAHISFKDISMTPTLKTVKTLSVALVLAFGVSAGLSACSPEVGSEDWCNELKEKPKGDWTANEAGDFAKHCIL